MNRLNFTLLFFAFLSLYACKNEPEYDIHPELQPYFDRFQEEAAARNIIVDFTSPKIEADIVQIVTGGVLGQCVKVDDQVSHLIHIQQEYWEDPETTDLDKEFVMFHELGHCTLNKGHINTADTDGACLSIMYDGNSTQCNLSYDLDTREAMLDDLFR